MIRRHLSPCVALLSALFMAGCGGSRHEAAEKYFLVAANVKITYWQDANAGLLRAAKELGVQAETVGPDTYDPAGQQERFRNTVGKKPAGILVSAADANLLKADIDSALAQGIPVITMDSDAPGSKRPLYIGTNNFEAGRTGGRVLAQQLKGKGNVVVFSMPGQANLEDRVRGYRDVLAASPGIRITRIVDVRGDPRLAFDATEEIVTKDAAGVDAFVCVEATACREVADVLNRKGVNGKVVVAMDTHDGTLEAIGSGAIVATIAQKPFTMSYYGLRLLDDLHHHKVTNLQSGGFAQDPFAPVPAFVDTGSMLIDKSNLEQFRSLRQSAGSR